MSGRRGVENFIAAAAIAAAIGGCAAPGGPSPAEVPISTAAPASPTGGGEPTATRPEATRGQETPFPRPSPTSSPVDIATGGTDPKSVISAEDLVQLDGMFGKNSCATDVGASNINGPENIVSLGRVPPEVVSGGVTFKLQEQAKSSGAIYVNEDGKQVVLPTVVQGAMVNGGRLFFVTKSVVCKDSETGGYSVRFADGDSKWRKDGSVSWMPVIVDDGSIAGYDDLGNLVMRDVKGGLKGVFVSDDPRDPDYGKWDRSPMALPVPTKVPINEPKPAATVAPLPPTAPAPKPADEVKIDVAPTVVVKEVPALDIQRNPGHTFYYVDKGGNVVGPVTATKVEWSGADNAWVAKTDKGETVGIYLNYPSGEGKWWQKSDEAVSGLFGKVVILDDVNTDWARLQGLISGVTLSPLAAGRLNRGETNRIISDALLKNFVANQAPVIKLSGESVVGAETIQNAMLTVLAKLRGVAIDEVRNQIQTGELKSVALRGMDGKNDSWIFASGLFVDETPNSPANTIDLPFVKTTPGVGGLGYGYWIDASGALHLSVYFGDGVRGSEKYGDGWARSVKLVSSMREILVNNGYNYPATDEYTFGAVTMGWQGGASNLTPPLTAVNR